MIKTGIFILIVLSSFSSGTYLALKSIDTINTKRDISLNKDKASNIKDILIKDIHRISNSSEYYAPVGDNTIAGYTALPSFLGSKRFTSGGVPFHYCPVSGTTTGGTDSIILPDSTTYNISTINNPAKAGYEYVNGSDFKLNDAVAFIVSPIGNKTDMPSCEDITYIQGNYIVPKGQVFAITEMDMLSQEQNTSVIEARVNETYTNDTTLEDGTEVESKSLTTNIERFKSSNINEMVIYLEAGTYNVPANTMVDINQKGKELSFVGNGSVVINTNTIDLKGVDIEFNNVDTNADIVINSSRLTVDGSEIFSLTAKGGDIRAIDARVVGNTTLNASTVRITDTFDFGQIQLFSGSKLDIFDANGLFDNGTLGIGLLNSQVNIDNSIVDINGDTAINNKGELTVWNSTVTSQGGTYGILSSGGAINRVFNSDMFTTGTQPAYSFFDDNNTGLITGNGTFSGVQCFEGEIFDDLAVITTADSTTHTVSNPNNQATWTCL